MKKVGLCDMGGGKSRMVFCGCVGDEVVVYMWFLLVLSVLGSNTFCFLFLLPTFPCRVLRLFEDTDIK